MVLAPSQIERALGCRVDSLDDLAVVAQALDGAGLVFLGQSLGHPAGLRPPAASVLIEVDLVAVEVLHQDAGAVGTDVGLAVELDAALLQGPVLAHAVTGFDAE